MSIARRGASEAGVIFVMIDRGDGSFDLYGPAPQSIFAEERLQDRLFLLVVEGRSEAEVRSLIERELNFDPDLWLVHIEDRQGRAFLEVVAG